MKLKIRLMFAWYDLWMGAYYDRKARALYVFPLPMLGLKVERRDHSVRSSELDVLRREQAERVVPLIGGLLDAWDQLPNDVSHEDELTNVKKHIERIDAAMEGQPQHTEH